MNEDLGHVEHAKRIDNLGIHNKVQRPLKIDYLGAGSGFLQNLFPDIMNIPGAEEGEFALVDIDETRLTLAHDLCRMIAGKMGRERWKITATTDRKEVLRGADYVINCIEVSGTKCVRFANDIPARYGVSQCIGDTIGPGGLFKALRTVPVFIEALMDIEDLCPDAWVLNYTNPMSIMCLAAARASEANIVGLCHSVQGTSHALADYTGVPYGQVKWRCGGINHLAWFTDLTANAEDLYPALKEKVRTDAEFLARDPIRFDMMRHFGYFITESSGHLSEYLPYYRKRPDLIQKHCGDDWCGGGGYYADNWPKWRVGCDENRRRQIDGEAEIQTARTWEYASYIIQAMETNEPFVIHGTMPNDNLIENLPRDGVVEVACLVNGNGIQPTHFGRLPPQCAAVCDSNMRMYDLAATACIERSREAAAHALMLDPLTAAVCSPGEIRRMVGELFEAEKEFLPDYD